MKEETKIINEIDYRIIPMDEITDQARLISIRWMEGWEEWMKTDIRHKHKLASDIMNYAKVQKEKLLPTDKETEKWFEEKIGIKNECSASSAIYKFRLWLNDRSDGKK